MNEVKIGNLPKLAIFEFFFLNYLKGAKIWWLFAELYKNPTDCFVLAVSTVSRFQNIIGSPDQEKEKIYI